MAKRNKIRYQSKDKPKVLLTVGSNIYLLHIDDEALETPQKGDLKVYPYNDLLNGMRCGDYESTGFSGYFKVDIYDGWGWRLILLNDVFPHRENHFSKSERPIDSYILCREILKKLAGKNLQRTYREHYTPEGAEEENQTS